MASRTDVMRIMGILSLTYPTFARDVDDAALEATVEIYHQILADIPADVLDAAARQHIASSRFFPTIAELRALCLAAVAPERVSALEAWGEVQDAIRRWSRYAMDGNQPLPTFSNPIIGQIVRSMGMIYLQDSENGTADRARFIEAYEELARRERDEMQLLPAFREKRAELAAARGNQSMRRLGDVIAGMLPERKQ